MGTGPAPEITVSVVSYNTCALLRTCLHSLEDGGTALEVVVADNGSTDGSVAMVKTEFPHVRLIETGGNIGYGRANNEALADARGRHVLILNSDAEVQPGALAAMRDFLDTHTACGVVGPRLMRPDGTVEPSGFAKPTVLSALWEQLYLNRLFPRSRLTGSFPVTYWDYNERRPFWALSGACLMVRRELFAAVGGFDPRYFMYFEDIDLCVRIRRTGSEIWFVPEATVRHSPGSSSQGDWHLRACMIAAYNQSRYDYFTRSEGRLSGTLLKAIVLFGASLRLLSWLLISCVRPQARSQVRLFREVVRHTWGISEKRE